MIEIALAIVAFLALAVGVLIFALARMGKARDEAHGE